MKTKNVIVLGIIAAIMLGATILLYTTHEKTGSFAKGTLLLPCFDANTIGSFVIRKDKDVVTLQRGQNGFTIAEKHGYPASAKIINHLLNNCFNVELADEITSNAANYADLGVDENGANATVVTLGDKEGKTIDGIICGKTAEGGKGNYVRRREKDTVYQTVASLMITSKPIQYMDTILVKNLENQQIAKVTFQQGEESYTLSKNAEGKITLAPLPENKRENEGVVNNLFKVISDLTFYDVIPASNCSATWTDSAQVDLENGQTYTIHHAVEGDKHYIKITSSMWKKVPSAKDITNQLSADELKEKEAILLGRDNAEAFSAKHMPWVYVISSSRGNSFAKKLVDLVEDIPTTNEPDEIAASHVLISWKGIPKTEATRSKEEAKVLAEKVLAEAKAPGADFAKIASKYSDCLSRTKGGDLGPFKKGIMAKSFEEAAWKLNVNEISDVVESQFGFHIIKRTK